MARPGWAGHVGAPRGGQLLRGALASRADSLAHAGASGTSEGPETRQLALGSRRQS